MRLASIFFVGAFLFFLVSLAATIFVFFVGGNSVSVDKVSLTFEGPTTITGGDTASLVVTITNTNAVPINDATIEITFPSSTRSADDATKPYPRYTENLGTLASGATVTRSLKARFFGGQGDALKTSASLSYAATGSNAVFVKETTYALTVSTTPLALTVETVSEVVSGQLLTLAITARSNASVPLTNVVVNSVMPFGFTVQDSSLPLSNGSFLIGTLAPGATKRITLSGTLSGQQNDQRAFHFSIGTAKTANDQALAVNYMTQNISVGIVAPFINTTLAINGDTGATGVLTAGAQQNITVSYTNTLTTTVTNANIAVAITGAAVDYESLRTENGFYRSSDHTIVFSRDTDPALAVLAPGASGLGTFSFSTLPVNALSASPSVTLTTSVSGTRVGQTNVPEQVTASAMRVAKVTTLPTLSAASLRMGGPLTSSGPIPPRVGQATTYTVLWSIRTHGGALAGNTLSATLPSYVTYTGATSGAGSFSYNPGARTVTWGVGDLGANSSAQGYFQVSITPSTSQRGTSPALTGGVTYSGYDRFAGVQANATTEAVTTETPTDLGYVAGKGVVQ